MAEFEGERDDEDLPQPNLLRPDSTSIEEEEDIPNLNYNQSIRLDCPPTNVNTPPPINTPPPDTNKNEDSTKRKDESKQPSDFLFGKCLGEGSYARVVHAKLKKNNVQFAIKIMEKMHIKKENKVKYVMMEKNILSKMQHPFIVRLYYTFQDAGYLYMAMDLAHGGELRSLIASEHRKHNSALAKSLGDGSSCAQSGDEGNDFDGIVDETPLPESYKACSIDTARFYLAEIVEAVEYLHSKNIIHRDLKPENILILSSGHLKLTDFGTAAYAEVGGDDVDLRNSFVGTAEYVSPEVLQDQNATKACDIWALGCILFSLLTGRTPFQSASEYLTFQSILHHCDGSEVLSFPDTIPMVAQDLIKSLLQAVPSERLGGGEGDKSIAALKGHNFFNEVSWGALHEQDPPYHPDPSTFPTTENMHDGANDEWLFEGEATPIGGGRMDSQDSDEIPFISKSRQNNRIVGRATVEGIAKYLYKGETQVFSDLIWKRKGLFSKHRLMILTDYPRLIYFDPTTMLQKGEIPWTKQWPVKCTARSDKAFDVYSPLSSRAYHITDSEAGSVMWIDLINAMLQKQAEGD